MEPNQMLRQWEETAKYWTRYSHVIQQMFAPVTDALISKTGIREGQLVLDVAGGAGEPSLTIAERVGPTGSVTCTDGVAEMVNAARAESVRRGLTNIQFQQCPADSLPFNDESFDVVVSRLGAMLFPDPAAACIEMLRVLKPGGAIAFVVWHKSEINPFCQIVTDVMSRHVPSEPADPDAPGAFRFAELGKLARILEAAGGAYVNDEILHFQIQAPISVDQFWTLRSETSDTLRTKLATLYELEREQIGEEVKELAREFFPNDRMNFPAQMIIVTGRKPAKSDPSTTLR